MLSKEKALYQVKLILDYLPQEEYDLIPQNTIDYIEDNFEYDENITINPDMPLEKQNIDEASYRYLEKIIAQVEEKSKDSEITNYISSVEESNRNNDTNEEIIRLKNIVEILQKENAKIPKVKDLVQEYKDELEKRNEEIKILKVNNNYLQNQLSKIPKFIRRIFIKKDEVKLLEDGKIN